MKTPLKVAALSRLERDARRAWVEWGAAFAKWTGCDRCGELSHCRAARRRGPFLCLTCFDLGPESE